MKNDWIACFDNHQDNNIIILLNFGGLWNLYLPTYYLAMHMGGGG